MTNYTSISSCAAAGQNAARGQKEPNIEPLRPEEWIGRNSDWNQRRAFEWGYLGAIYRRIGDDEIATYCQGRIDQLKVSRGY